MLLIARCAMTASYLFAILYSTVFLKRNQRPSYFKCAFYGLLPLCLSSFYYLALMTMDDTAPGFTLGILGEISAYIFIITANSGLIPKEESEQKAHISILGLTAAFILLLILFAPALVSFRIPVLFTSLLYVLVMCPCLYSCVDLCRNRFNNPFKAGVRPFNRMIILHLFCTAALPAAQALTVGISCAVLTALCALGCVLSGCIGMAVLKKGLSPWEL